MSVDAGPGSPTPHIARAMHLTRNLLVRAKRVAVLVLPSVRLWFLVAVGIGLASGYVSGPYEEAPPDEPRPNTEHQELRLQTLDETRDVPVQPDGVSLAIDIERVATNVVVRATLRNDGPRRFLVSWPKTCRAGSVIYRDGREGVFFRAVRFSPNASVYLLHSPVMRDPERNWEGFGVALEPGDLIVDTFGLKEADAECFVDGGVLRIGHEVGDPTTFDRVFVGYDLTVPDPDWEGPLLPDGRRKVPEGCEWRFLIASGEVPSEASVEPTLEPAPRWSRVRSLAPLDQRRGELVIAHVPPKSHPRLRADQLAQLEARIEYFGGRDWREVLSRSGVEPQFYAQLRNEVIEVMSPEQRYGRNEAPSDYQLAIRKELDRLQRLGRKGLRFEHLGALPPGAR